MCYDISFTISIDRIQDYFPGLKVKPEVNIGFTADHVQAQAFQAFPIVSMGEGNILELSAFEWGVIADYMKTPADIKKGRSLMCNAQAEKVLQVKNSYWRRIRQNRCLVPVTGIYEHREVKSFKNKIPYHVKLKSRDMFCLPGLFAYYPDSETGEKLGSFTIITRKANSVMEKIHNGGTHSGRMPLFLTKELELEWLKADLEDDKIQDILNYAAPDEDLEYWPVHTIRGGKERPDQLRKFEPYVWANLPELGIDNPVQQQNLF